MFMNKPPKTGKNGEIRYWAFRDPSGQFYLEKVKCLRTTYDKENGHYIYRCELQSPVSTFRLGMKPGYNTVIDYAWQLQKTLEDAQKLLIIGTLKEADFLTSKPAWEQ
jgi:hypothetical protein